MSGKNPIPTRDGQIYEGVNVIVPVGGWQLIKSTRSPTTNDKKYPVGAIWVDTTTNSAYILTSAPGNWSLFGTSSGGAINSITGDSGGAELPSSGNFNLLGTANQITVTGSAATETFSLSATLVAPGSVTATTSLAAGTTVTGGTGVTATTGNVTATAGAVNAGTSITATLGDITATNGNLSLATAGNKIIIATGANASVGTSSAMSGTPGAVTVATTASSATAKIFYSRETTGGTPGEVSITAQDGTGFTLTSTANETSTFNWWIINA